MTVQESIVRSRRRLVIILPFAVIFLLVLGNLTEFKPLQRYKPVTENSRRVSAFSSATTTNRNDTLSTSDSSLNTPFAYETNNSSNFISVSILHDEDPSTANTSSSLPPLLQSSTNTSKLSQQSSKSYWTIMTTINFAFLDFFYNWYYHYDLLNLTLDMILVAEDDLTFKHLEGFRASYYATKFNISMTNIAAGNNNSSDLLLGTTTDDERLRTPKITIERSALQLGNASNMSVGWGEDNYKKMMSARPRMIRKKLEAGYNLIFTDVDFIWLKNPLPYFDNNSIQFYNSMDPKDVRCGGFWACRSTPGTIKFAKKWEDALRKRPGHNQLSFNHLINRQEHQENINTTKLSNHDFMNGNNVKRTSDAKRKNATGMHFNMVTHSEHKQKQMMKYWYWALSNNNYSDSFTMAHKKQDSLSSVVG